MTNAEAIKRLENDCCKSRVYCELYPDACQKEECEIYMAIEALERTPNAFPTHECVNPTHECVEPVGNSDTLRPKGKWIDYTDEGYVECPFCHSATNCDGNKDELHFCFSCGAYMRGEE